MKRQHAFFAIFTAISIIGLSRAEEINRLEPVDIIRKAINARGGREVLAKYINYRVRLKGLIFFDNHKSSATFEYLHRSHPRSFKSILEIEAPKIIQTSVFNGKSFWRKSDGITHEGNDRDLREARFLIYNTDICNSLLPLLKKNQFVLTSLPATNINGREAIGVRVSSVIFPDIDLYFDKQTALLVKNEYRYKENSGDESIVKEIRGDYKRQKGGLLFHTKATRIVNGTKRFEVELVDIEALSEAKDSHFSKP